jgi:hypothetical protein
MALLLATDFPDNYSLSPLKSLSGDFANKIPPFFFTFPRLNKKLAPGL